MSLDQNKAALRLAHFLKKVHTCPVSLDLIPFSKQVYLRGTTSPFHINSIRTLILHEGMEAKNPLTRVKLDPRFVHFIMKKSANPTSFSFIMSTIKSTAQTLTYFLDKAWETFQLNKSSSDHYHFLVESTTDLLGNGIDAYTRDCILGLIPADHACMVRLKLF